VENLFYFLSVSQICIGVYLIWQGLQWLSYARRRMSIDPGFRAPRVAVLCPCKGVEPGLERNLVTLTEFDHQNYEVFFILASEADPAISIVRRIATQSRHRAHVIIAGEPTSCGEKVNNLRFAIEQLPPEFDVLVFVDSDGRPGKSWLQRLVAPLSDSRVGAVTTMRWIIPNRNNLATLLLAAWNAPLVTMLSEKGKNFCWGGGTAILRTIFEQIGALEEWKHSVSDDYSMTSALERARRPILFVPECLMPSFAETDFSGLFEFTNRQILITRVYAERLWAPAAATHLFYSSTLIFGIVLTLAAFFAQRPALHLAALTLLPLLLSAIRSALRLAGVTEILPAWRAQIMSQAWIYIFLTIFIPFLYLLNFLNSIVTRKIRWRGIQYELMTPDQTRITTL